MKICEAANTILPTLYCLEELGFTISKKQLNHYEVWVAVKDDIELQSRNIETILGLAKLVEMRGKDWALDEENFDRLIKKYKFID